MMLRFAKRSSIEETVLNNSWASALSVVPFNFFINVRVVLAWYLFNTRFASFALILFNADLLRQRMPLWLPGVI